MIMLLTTTIPSFADFYLNGIHYSETSGSTVEVRPTPNKYTGDIVIPEKVANDGVTYSVTSIIVAFNDCTNLTSVTIPKSVTNITSAFGNCSSLTSINVDSANPIFCSDCGVLFNKDKTSVITFPGGYKGGYSIPNSVTSIARYAFYKCANLTSITIPNSVKSISEGAFSDCTGLTSITIPNTVTTIGQSVFYNCTGLTSVTITNSVTSISRETFFGCKGLKSIVIPNSVTSIGINACSGCLELAPVILPDAITSIGDYAFNRCNSLTSITIPNSVTSIGNSAFSNCENLKSINVDNDNTKYSSENGILFNKDKDTIIVFPNGISSYFNVPNTVKSIGASAFCGCNSLTTIIIPNSIINIGSNAFQFCTGLADIYSYILQPDNASLGNNVFNDVILSTCKLHVIKGTKALYQAADQWKDFKNIVDDIAVPAGIDNVQTANSFKCHADGENIYVTSDKALDGVEVYSLDGKMITRSLEKSNSYIIPIKEKACIIRSGKTAVKERLRRY